MKGMSTTVDRHRGREEPKVTAWLSDGRRTSVYFGCARGHWRTEEEARAEAARRQRVSQPTPVDPVLSYVRGMRRDDTQNPGPVGSTDRRGGVVNFQQAEAMPSGLMRGEFKRAGLSGGEYLEALIKEYAARFDGQEALAVTMEGESPFLDALAAALDIEVIHV